MKLQNALSINMTPIQSMTGQGYGIHCITITSVISIMIINDCMVRTRSKQFTDPIMKTESLSTSATVSLKSMKSSLSSGNSV